MHLNLLDKYENLKPFLVEMYDSHQRYNLSKEEDKERARDELADAIGVLFEKKLLPEEKDLIADILLSLIEQAGLRVRCSVAQRIAHIEGVPLNVVLKFANDEISVAADILRFSPVLADLDLVYIIQSKGAEYWRQIAQRQHLSNKVMGILADQRDVETALTLLKNKSLKLSNHVLGVMAEMSQGYDIIVDALAERTDISGDIRAKVFEFTAKDLKQKLGEHMDLSDSFYKQVMDTVDDVLDDIVDDMANLQGEGDNPQPTATMIVDARKKKERGELTLNGVMKSLRRGHLQRFVAEFSAHIKLDVRVLVTILAQDSGQELAVLCKAYDIQKPDFMSIYLLTTRIRNKGVMVDTMAITSAVNYYNTISKDAALDILERSNYII